MNNLRGPIGHREFLLVELYLYEYYLSRNSPTDYTTQNTESLEYVFENANLDFGVSTKVNSTAPIYDE